MSEPRVLVVYLAVVEQEGAMRVCCRGVFASKEDAAKLPDLKGQVGRNLVSVFEDRDMGFHVGVIIETKP